MRLKPYEQGALSSLCGIYSIVNAMRIIRSLNNDESKAVFEEIVYYLENSKSFAVSLISGISVTVIGSIFKDVIQDRMNRSIPFQKQPDVRIGQFWTEMKKFIDEGRAEEEKRVILLSLGGQHDHWTIAHRITKKRVILFDSIGLRYLDRRNCTTREAPSGRRHLIHPTQTYFLK